jgi:hypothetical protein
VHTTSVTSSSCQNQNNQKINSTVINDNPASVSHWCWRHQAASAFAPPDKHSSVDRLRQNPLQVQQPPNPHRHRHTQGRLPWHVQAAPAPSQVLLDLNTSAATIVITCWLTADCTVPTQQDWRAQQLQVHASVRPRHSRKSSSWNALVHSHALPPTVRMVPSSWRIPCLLQQHCNKTLVRPSVAATSAAAALQVAADLRDQTRQVHHCLPAH